MQAVHLEREVLADLPLEPVREQHDDRALAEAREGQELRLNWDIAPDGTLQADATTVVDETTHRVFSAKLLF